MNVYVRAYQSLGWDIPAEKFLARAIVRETTSDGAAREGFSVCFYGETANAAEAKAFDWIEKEREKAAAKDATIRALIERQRKT